MAEDPLDTIHAALQKTGIYIHPSLENQFTKEQVTKIRANIAAHAEPVYVVAWPLRESDKFNGNTADLLTRLHDAHPEPGVYVATTTRLTTDTLGIELEGRQWGVGSGDGDLSPYQLLSAVRYTEPDTLGAAFVQATDLLNQPVEQVVEEYDDAYAAYREEHPPSTGGDGSGPSTAVAVTERPIAARVVGVLVVVVHQVRTRLRRQEGRGQAHVLPPSAMAQIRQAHDRKLDKRARADVLALGEAIDQGEITESGNSAAWRAALDHYDAARRLLRSVEDPDVLDVIGAIVLSDNGRRALEAAQRGKTFTAPTRCFLNPLHGVTGDHRAVERDGRSVQAPLCRACRDALTKGTTPDILDVERRGKAVHYFDSGSEPWASTGFGALETDLVTRLQTKN
ncbi:MAG: hypothetical protein L0H93_01865 [Nocardioides sp.]|nr:hypothetical protein [Nocardioides sp.]